jgi:hypothetical protein
MKAVICIKYGPPEVLQQQRKKDLHGQDFVQH